MNQAKVIAVNECTISSVHQYDSIECLVLLTSLSNYDGQRLDPSLSERLGSGYHIFGIFRDGVQPPVNIFCVRSIYGRGATIYGNHI